MNFAEAISSGFGKYKDFGGRASRSEYWQWAFFIFLVGIIADSIDAKLGASIFGLIVNLTLLLPSFAVGVRRLHDQDRSGWWMMIAFTIIGLLVLIYWTSVRGTVGPNRFGDDPLAVHHDQPSSL